MRQPANVSSNGECYNSCLYLAVWAEGKHITTLEGLMGPNGELSDIQQAFMEETSIQCGFCIPGFIMTAVEILDRGVYYTDDQLRKLLSGHLCRCTGYQNILNAVERAVDEAHRADLVQQPDQVAGLDASGLGMSRYLARYGRYPAWKNTAAQYFACGEAMYPSCCGIWSGPSTRSLWNISSCTPAKCGTVWKPSSGARPRRGWTCA